MRIAALILLLASAAHAITQAKIDDAASRAHNGLRSVIKKLADKKLAGRDNTTNGSLDAQKYLESKGLI